MLQAGIIGGLGPEATMMYYDGIIQRYQSRHNSKTVLPELLIKSVDMYHMFAMLDEGRVDDVASYLAHAANNLQAAGADFGFMCGSTPHVVFDAIQSKTTLPLMSIIDTSRHEAQDRHLSRLALLGTKFTMQRGFFEPSFERQGIRVFTPDDDQQAYIHEKIVSELENGVVKADTKATLVEIVRVMTEKYQLDGVILGCTELPLILSQSDFDIAVLDIAQIHMDSIVEKMDDTHQEN